MQTDWAGARATAERMRLERVHVVPPPWSLGARAAAVETSVLGPAARTGSRQFALGPAAIRTGSPALQLTPPAAPARPATSAAAPGPPARDSPGCLAAVAASEWAAAAVRQDDFGSPRPKNRLWPAPRRAAASGGEKTTTWGSGAPMPLSLHRSSQLRFSFSVLGVQICAAGTAPKGIAASRLRVGFLLDSSAEGGLAQANTTELNGF